MNDIETDISEEERIVPGFKEGIKLLDHQILGRKWMKDREDPSQKRFGGILADDMGYVTLITCPLSTSKKTLVLERPFKH
jgi:hypothetical protein